MSRPRGSDGQATPPSRSFDPRPHLRRIRVRGQEAEYLDVKWRLAWLRTEHPDARITTEHVTLSDSLAVFRALVEIPGGGAATGYGSETRDDWEDFIEKAETKAIGRALAALGYGTQFALDFDLEEDSTGSPQPLADAPVEHQPPATPTEPSRRPRPRLVPPPETVQPQPEATRTTEPPAPAPAPAPEPEPASEPARTREPSPEPGRPDRNWTSFWTEVRRLGYKNKAELEQFLGHSIDTASTPPDEIWAELMAHRRRRGLEE